MSSRGIKTVLQKSLTASVYQSEMEFGYHSDSQYYSEQRRETMPENAYNAPTEPQDIPDDLKVPDGNILLLQAYGKGVQMYDCPFVDFAKATPHAILFTGDRDEGDLVAIHFKGPSWQAMDGSIVVGDAANAKHVVAPDPDGVDWLLLPAKSNTGNGLFSKVTYIQRLFTDGSKATLASCDQVQGQTQELVEYSAQYLFYVATPDNR